MNLKTIVVIGWMGKNYEGAYICDRMEEMGIKVIRIAADKLQYSKNHPIEKANYIIDEKLDGEHHKFKKKVSMKTIFKNLKITARYHIIVMQNDLPLDFGGTRIHYWIREIYWKDWPMNAKVDMVFYSYLGAINMYKDIHRYAMANIKNTQFLSYGWDENQYPMTNMGKRPILFGFMGWVGKDNSDAVNPDEDYLKFHMRDYRARYVNYAKEHLGLVVKEKGTDQEYVEFMNQCSLAINIPGIAGFVNQRQYHAMGMGCVLVQFYFKGIKDLDFIHGYNCLLFKNEDELERIIEFAKAYPEDIEKIRVKGRELAKLNTSKKIVETIIETLNLNYE